MEVEALKAAGDVIFYQEYDEERKQPLVVVVMTKWMREVVAPRFSGESAWALDSTFKTNQFHLPLYGAMVPNQDGVGMPLFFMLCSADKGEQHEGAALSMTLKAVFDAISVRPRAIVIDKSFVELNAIQPVLEADYRDNPHLYGGGTEPPIRILLCWFHAKKAWVDHLLPKVKKEERAELFRRMDGLLLSDNEGVHQERLAQFRAAYAASEYKSVISYVESGWVGEGCVWKDMWPLFKRAFRHGDVNTTNLIERTWQTLKYSVFGRKVNKRVHDLILAIVGSASGDGFHGKTPLIEHYVVKQEIGKCNDVFFLLNMMHCIKLGNVVLRVGRFIVITMRFTKARIKHRVCVAIMFHVFH